MRIGDYEVVVSSGHDRGDGYVEMEHDTKYAVIMKNHNKFKRCIRRETSR